MIWFRARWTSSTPVVHASTLAMLALAGLIRLPANNPITSVIDHLRSVEANRYDREARAGGYYEGLLHDNRGPQGRSVLAWLGVGESPSGRQIGFDEAGVARELAGDPLMFELIANLDHSVLGTRFTTNAWGLRDRPILVETDADRPLLRIALLGSSMDMGWGVETDQTYENLLEDWLNAEADRRKLPHQYVIDNYAVAAYSPAQRILTYQRKAAKTAPDYVMYAITRLDTRLQEIHLVNLIQGNIPGTIGPIQQAIDETGISPLTLARDSQGRLLDRRAVKAKLRGQIRPAITRTLIAWAEEVRSDGADPIFLLIPRASLDDRPSNRASDVQATKQLTDQADAPLLDATGAFDRGHPERYAIARGDDHPNAEGHRLIAQSLIDAILNQPHILFPARSSSKDQE